MVLVPLKKSNVVFCYGASVLFTEAFDVWYDTASSFYKLSCGCVWLFVGFMLGFALLKERLDSGCLVGLCEGDPFLLQGIQV